ncbi:hypothetical protein JAAARDRAFT_31637 [Jaapia argillacea MUCL 33604]|uniref:Chord-domain-containing protein n=1 Tax=Jaapia argillacea MUCL 33604 TaxID=933084 RepID=A0A067QAX4_9AGAM|nr:hypothetical protein JAAARDRAFT_31637 [Jaapia argillacea MUCL 33604]
MVRCTRKGCGQDYDPAMNSDTSCSFHSGGPVFHEGLKSWSCCEDVNRPVLDFDDFMKIPGCSQGPHTDSAPVIEAPRPSQAQTSKNLQRVEENVTSPTSSAVPGTQTPLRSGSMTPLPAKVDMSSLVDADEDDLETPVPTGTKCRRKGCEVAYVSDEIHRRPDGEGAVCTYHTMPPIFREGSKGYLCCKRRVLEFDEFLKIEGCTKGRHLFVPKSKCDTKEELADCRIDHYQTPSEVHVSVFAKQVDKQRSAIKFEEAKVHFDVYFQGSKRFRKSMDLFGPINPDTSTFTIYGTKIEVIMKKTDGRSWTILEKPTRDLGNISLTFGVGGRTGTIGAKEIVLDAVNQSRT